MRRLTALPLLVLLTASACGGGDGDSANNGDSSARTVEVDMVDIAFSPKQLEVKKGETVRFVFTNTGKAIHDAFIGNREAQDEHEAEMRAADGAAHGGGHESSSSSGVTVEPGKTGELTHTFSASEPIEIGCHQPGHYAAGMKLAVTVA